ncbi:hypothetical protein B0H13DRAFT_1886714 [Mycena leptocephala]|nr:hypothetical protein B0H13DRAFT_1886714 [Mycena leptocephala]
MATSLPIRSASTFPPPPPPCFQVEDQAGSGVPRPASCRLSDWGIEGLASGRGAVTEGTGVASHRPRSRNMNTVTTFNSQCNPCAWPQLIITTTHRSTSRLIASNNNLRVAIAVHIMICGVDTQALLWREDAFIQRIEDSEEPLRRCVISGSAATDIANSSVAASVWREDRDVTQYSILVPWPTGKRLRDGHWTRRMRTRPSSKGLQLSPTLPGPPVPKLAPAFLPIRDANPSIRQSANLTVCTTRNAG